MTFGTAAMELRIAPSTPTGWWALSLAAVVVLYPLYWSVLLVLPLGLRPFIVVVLAAAAVASLVLGGLSVLRRRDRSVLLIAALALMLLGVLFFAAGELLFPH